MANDYEKKLAIKRAKADARKALNDWYKYSNMEIDQILKEMGYERKGYKYSKRVWTGMKSFTICLDTYELIICSGSSIKFEVEE